MELKLANNILAITLEGQEQLWSARFSKNIYVPLNHITNVTTGNPDGLWKGIRAPGTFVPGLIRAGTYYTARGREFWYVTRQDGPLDQTTVLTLDLSPEEYYKRIVLSAKDCHLWGDRVRQAMQNP